MVIATSTIETTYNKSDLLNLLDMYIAYWSDDDITEWYYDMTAAEVLVELRKVIRTGDIPEHIVKFNQGD